MKRLVVLLLAVLLLCGCSAEPVPTTEPTTAPTQPPKALPGIYEAGSAVEEETAGAVRTYLPKINGFPEIAFMGSRMLLLDEDSKLERTRITVLEGENLSPGRSVVIDSCISVTDPTFWTSARELAYYDSKNNRVVWLDENLTETRHADLPDGAASPMLSSDLRMVYYCLDNEIHVLEVDLGIHRLLKQHSCLYQNLLGIHLGDTVLEVFLTGETAGKVVFVSTETGETLGEDSYTSLVRSHGDNYLILRNDGFMEEILLGTGSEKLRNLEPLGENLRITPMLPMSTVLVTEGTGLTLYNIQTGRRVSTVSFREAGSIYCATADPDGKTLWMLRNDLQTGKTSLYRWDSSMTALQEDRVYTHPRYTADDPDVEGLARCEERAKTLSQTYGVQILLRNDPKAPADYRFRYEYDVTAFEKALDALEEKLALFPDGFLTELGTASRNGQITIGLVRSMEGTAANTVDEGAGVQYYLDGDVWITLAVGEQTGQMFCHELMHVLDTYVMNRSDAYDDWDDLNPRKFSYFENYTDYRGVSEFDSHLLGEDRAFVDAYSMSYSKEDRARIFQYALQEGQEELFASDIMQKKLRQIGIGIRNAFGWKKESTVFPWEVYLEKPLAKK